MWDVLFMSFYHLDKSMNTKVASKYINYMEGQRTVNRCVSINMFKACHKSLNAKSKFHCQRWGLGWNGWTTANHKHSDIVIRTLSLTINNRYLQCIALWTYTVENFPVFKMNISKQLWQINKPIFVIKL